MTARNLWGDLGDLNTIRTPALILQEQAGYLGELTSGLLEGYIRRDSLARENRFDISLYILAPSLGRYRFKVLELSYTIERAYPVRIRDSIGGKDYNAHDENDLLRILGTLLTSESVKRVIASLISESQMPIQD